MKKRARENDKFPSVYEIKQDPELLKQAEERMERPDMFAANDCTDSVSLFVHTQKTPHVQIILRLPLEEYKGPQFAVSKDGVPLAIAWAFQQTPEYVTLECILHPETNILDDKYTEHLLECVKYMNALLVALKDIGIPLSRVQLRFTFERQSPADAGWTGNISQMATIAADAANAVGIKWCRVVFDGFSGDDDLTASCVARERLNSFEYVCEDGVVTAITKAAASCLITKQFDADHFLMSRIKTCSFSDITDLTMRIHCFDIWRAAALKALPNLRLLDLTVGTSRYYNSAESKDPCCAAAIVSDIENGTRFDSLLDLRYECYGSCHPACRGPERLFEWIVSRAQQITAVTITLPLAQRVGPTDLGENWFAASKLCGMFTGVNTLEYDEKLPSLLQGVMDIILHAGGLFRRHTKLDDGSTLLELFDYGYKTLKQEPGGEDDDEDPIFTQYGPGYDFLFTKFKALTYVDVVDGRSSAPAVSNKKRKRREFWQVFSFHVAAYRAVRKPRVMESYLNAKFESMFYEWIMPYLGGDRVCYNPTCYQSVWPILVE